jgi:hypothetical protein
LVTHPMTNVALLLRSHADAHMAFELPLNLTKSIKVIIIVDVTT